MHSHTNHIPSGTATVFHFVYPAVVIIGEFIFLKTKVGTWHIVSVILCVMGIALFYNPSSQINMRGSVLAILFALSLNVGAVVLFQQGTFLIGGGRASVLSTFEPITSVIAGVLIFNEEITALTFSGTFLVITVCIVIALNDIKKTSK